MVLDPGGTTASRTSMLTSRLQVVRKHGCACGISRLFAKDTVEDLSISSIFMGLSVFYVPPPHLSRCLHHPPADNDVCFGALYLDALDVARNY